MAICNSYGETTPLIWRPYKNYADGSRVEHWRGDEKGGILDEGVEKLRKLAILLVLTPHHSNAGGSMQEQTKLRSSLKLHGTLFSILTIKVANKRILPQV